MGFIDNILENLGLDGLGEGVKSKLMIADFTSAYVEGVKSILAFTEEQVTLNLKNGKLTFNGKDLSVKKFCEGDVVICGKIMTIEKD